MLGIELSPSFIVAHPVASAIQPNTPFLALFWPTNPEPNHHGLPSAVDCGGHVGPHGRPPAMGMSSISLGKCSQLRLSSLGTHVHCRAPKDGGASFSMALALLVSGAVMCCVSISITESKTDEAKDNMGGRRTGGSKG
jgi:hypothetical protein